MIRFLRKYQRGVMGVLAVGFICLAMAGFGVDILGNGRNRPAIKVNGEKISYDEFYQHSRELRERYQQMFKGNNFEQLARSLGLNINQQTVDQLVDGALLDQAAENVGFGTGDEELRAQLRQAFPDNETYKSYLRQVRMNGVQFEARMRQELARAQFNAAISDVSKISRAEALRMVRDQETAYSAEWAVLPPANYKAGVKPRDEADLKRYYEENTTQFETEPTVAYQYVVFDPAKFVSSVELNDEDIAFYFSEHESKFLAPAKALVRQIQLLYPKESDPEKMNAVKARAEEVLAKVQAGESFDALALEYSDDITTKGMGGSLGWVEQSALSKEIGEAVFRLAAPGVPDLIQSETGYSVVKVDEFKPSAPKELSEVREEIIKTLRDEEAPVYAASKALEVQTSLAKDPSAADLNAAVAVFGLSVDKTAAPMAAGADPKTEVAGLTAKVIEGAPETVQLIELGKQTILVKIDAYHEAAIPPFEDVKAKIVDHFAEIDAKDAARAAAQKVLDAAKAGKSLADAAMAEKVEVKSENELKESVVGKGVFADAKLREKLFRLHQPGAVDGVFETPDGFVVAAVKAIAVPKDQDIADKVDSFRDQESKSTQRALYQALIAKLKRESEIDYDPGLVAS